MRITVPITGTVIDFNPESANLDGCGISGDPADPVRVDIDLGNVSWKLVGIDIEAGEAEIEVTPSDIITVLKAGGNPNTPADHIKKKTSNAEKQSFLSVAQQGANSAPRGLLKLNPGILNKYKNWKLAKKAGLN